MVALEPLHDFLQIILWSGKVEGERPVSCILVAPPEHGKTSLLERIECDTAPLMSDMTAREISAKLKECPRATHLLLGDMLALFGHKSHVIRLAMRTISAMTGETLRSDPFSGDNVTKQIGLITAIPPENMKNPAIKRALADGGFATRFLVVEYYYSPSTESAIHKFIREDRYAKKESKQMFMTQSLGSEQSLAITIPERMSLEIEKMALQIRKANTLGTRQHLHLRALVKASARRSGRTVAKAEDLEKIIEHTDFFLGKGKRL